MFLYTYWQVYGILTIYILYDIYIAKSMSLLKTCYRQRTISSTFIANGVVFLRTYALVYMYHMIYKIPVLGSQLVIIVILRFVCLICLSKEEDAAVAGNL